MFCARIYKEFLVISQICQSTIKQFIIKEICSYIKHVVFYKGNTRLSQDHNLNISQVETTFVLRT